MNTRRRIRGRGAARNQTPQAIGRCPCPVAPAPDHGRAQDRDIAGARHDARRQGVGAGSATRHTLRAHQWHLCPRTRVPLARGLNAGTGSMFGRSPRGLPHGRGRTARDIEHLRTDPVSVPTTKTSSSKRENENAVSPTSMSMAFRALPACSKVVSARACARGRGVRVGAYFGVWDIAWRANDGAAGHTSAAGMAANALR